MLSKNKKISLGIMIIAILILMGVGTYSFFSADLIGNIEEEHLIKYTGILEVTYIEGDNIHATKIRPGWIGTKTFTVKNTGTLPTNYDIVFSDLINTFLNDELIYSGTCVSNLDTCDSISEMVVLEEEYFIKQNISIEPEEEHSYEINIEFIETGDNQDYNIQANLAGKIDIYETGTYTVASNITVDLVDNMIPIAWNSDKWVKVDIDNVDNNWYDYNNQKWANAVLVTNASREGYKNANINTAILEEDVLAYYVYIPRYRYQLWNVNNNENCLNDNCAEQEIKIVFEKKEMSKASGSQNGQWLTHPAFTFGESELSGIWVGKFTTSVDPSSTCFITPNEANCNDKNLLLRIKPNVDPWRYNQVSTMFSAAKKIQTSSIYGLTTYENIDSHLMKNMEWGATAYLSHSKYGKYGNEDYTGLDKEIYPNNYNADEANHYRRETGCSAGTPNAVEIDTNCPHPYPLLTNEATGASTTGNIYGIYDMSGGVWEYVMGQIVENNTTEIGTFHNNSGSGTWEIIPDAKYYDSYAYTLEWGNNNLGYLGDATRETLLEFVDEEMGGWYNDWSLFRDSSSPWIARSGTSSDTNAGIFSYMGLKGTADSYNGFRSIIVIQ